MLVILMKRYTCNSKQSQSSHGKICNAVVASKTKVHLGESKLIRFETVLYLIKRSSSKSFPTVRKMQTLRHRNLHLLSCLLLHKKNRIFLVQLLYEDKLLEIPITRTKILCQRGFKKHQVHTKQYSSFSGIH